MLSNRIILDWLWMASGVFACFMFAHGMCPVAFSQRNASSQSPALNATADKKLETATFGGGCFWCVEAVYQRVHGVTKVISGYAGGHVPYPTYEQVGTKKTGHAEVCQITFDPDIISFEEMLLIFFKSHDPTTLNKQGLDEGPQYRSVVFYDGDDQRIATEKMIAKLRDEKIYRRKILTEVSPLPEFYVAEAYHQNFFKNNPMHSYCQMVVQPKVDKFEKMFKENSLLQKQKEAKKQKK